MGKLAAFLLFLLFSDVNHLASAQSMMTLPGSNDSIPSQPNTEELQSQANLRINAIKRSLNLTPPQESAWRPVERALMDYEMARIDHQREMREFNQSRRNNNLGASPVERLQIGSRQLRESSDRLMSIAEVLPFLLNALDDGQKRKLYTLLPRASEIMDKPVATPQPPRLLK